MLKWRGRRWRSSSFVLCVDITVASRHSNFDFFFSFFFHLLVNANVSATAAALCTHVRNYITVEPSVAVCVLETFCATLSDHFGVEFVIREKPKWPDILRTRTHIIRP